MVRVQTLAVLFLLGSFHLVLGTELRTVSILDKCSTNELHFPSQSKVSNG